MTTPPESFASPTHHAPMGPAPALGPLLLRGLGLAAIGAAICAFAWGQIANITGYEIGYLAWGVGWLVGFAFMIGSNGEAGMAGVVAASLMSVLGLVAGKYYGATLMIGANAPDVAITPMLYLTQIYPNHLADPMDLLWLGLAVFGAFGVAKNSTAT